MPVLEDAGSISHKQALAWAEDQYGSFSDRRRLEAESLSGANYIEDLRETAKEIEAKVKPLKKTGELKKKR